MRWISRIWREYRAVILLLLALFVFSAPWIWQFDPILASVASNVFAAVLVTPALIFGVDRAVDRVARRRRVVRDAAIIAELREAVGSVLNGVVGAAALGGILPDVGKILAAGGNPATVTAQYAIDHEDQVAAGLRARDDDALRVLVRSLQEERQRLEQVLKIGTRIRSHPHISLSRSTR